MPACELVPKHLALRGDQGQGNHFAKKSSHSRAAGSNSHVPAANSIADIAPICGAMKQTVDSNRINLENRLVHREIPWPVPVFAVEQGTFHIDRVVGKKFQVLSAWRQVDSLRCDSLYRIATTRSSFVAELNSPLYRPL